MGTQVIALFLSVYGFFGYDENIGAIGWPRGLIVLAISLGTFLLLDVVKVLMIHTWDKYLDKRTRSPVAKRRSMLPWQRKQKLGDRAQEFQKRHELHSRAGYDRALRRESVSSVQSY